MVLNAKDLRRGHCLCRAQAIIASDVNFKEKWEAEIKRLVAGNEWTGLRAPEADIIASALHRLQRLLAEGD